MKRKNEVTKERKGMRLFEKCEKKIKENGSEKKGKE